jgi:hypothetical protein
VKNYKKIAVALLAALLVSVLSGKAQTLNFTGGSVVNSLTNQELIGSSPPYIGGNFGTVSSWVVNDPGLDSSGLIFVYELVNSGPDSMNTASFSDFNGAYVSSGTYSNLVGSVTLPGSINPSIINGEFSFFDLSPGGAATFETTLAEGFPNGNSTSWFLVVDTDENSYTDSYVTTDDNYTSFGAILAPSEVPEPRASLVLLIGLASFYGILRFRRLA